MAYSLDAADRPLLTAVYCSLIWANAKDPMMMAKNTLMIMPTSAWSWVTSMPPARELCQGIVAENTVEES